MKKHCFVVLAYKESEHLENCIQSVLHQKENSDVVIATSTPNEFISSMAQKYQLQVIENSQPGRGIGYDFDFARQCVNHELVTIAHQDDLYEKNYSHEVLQAYQKHQDALIIFSDYYEIRNQQQVHTNTNLKIKRVLLSLLRIQPLSGFKWIKQTSICFGNAICCPAVTFVNKNIDLNEVFVSDMKCNIDWLGWERISRKKGKFIYLKSHLMGHRVHEGSTTSEIIKDNIRTKEDFEMFSLFWPEWFVKKINKLYINSEKSNQLK